MIQDNIQAKLNVAKEALESTREMGWECEILTDTYPANIIFTKSQTTLFEEESPVYITFTFLSETNTAVAWNCVDIKEIKKLKELAEKYAELYYKWFFMQHTTKEVK
ncbi:MAG: hypothetical protein RR052_03505 [Oscillospiraceae bacterium]